MHLNQEAGGSKKSNTDEKEYAYYKVMPRSDKGGALWYRSYYYQNGVLKSEWTMPVETTSSTSKSSSGSSSKKSSGSSSAKKTTTKPAKPTVRKKPVLSVAAPGPAPSLVFNMAEPILKEVIVPQPVPDPGPAPEFTFEERKEVTKYEYVYGLKHLEIKHKQYEPKSIFVSKPIKPEGNVMQVSLHAIEDHPIFDQLSGEASDRQTSIEYYVTYAETPTQSDWLPILPEGEKRVRSELLMFTSGKTAKLRFPALVVSDQKAVVYKNQVAIDYSQWSFADGGTKLQLLGEQDPTAIYTIDYTPNVNAYNPWIIDVRQQGIKTVETTETFKDGTNHNKTVVLNKYPYVDYEKINLTDVYEPNTNDYKPLTVKLKNASIAGPNRTTFTEVKPYDGTDTQITFTKNITDYKTSEWKQAKPYSLKNEDRYNGFEYWQEGNKLYFSETFNKADIYTNQETNHGNAEIEVTYRYLESSFRIKIILRRNSSDVNTLTPMVHEYALKFKVMK